MEQPELDLRIVSNPGIVHINGRCMLKMRGGKVALVRPHYARADQEGRTLISSALKSSADIEATRSELHVTLAPLSSEHRSKAVASMCEELNGMDVCFPGTELKLRFGVSKWGKNT